eukprot:TRINITY_DN50990_c0_g1_i1.p1 TRINITY_DN50990_c0_g1~~TRINITY_DN50990_c0_g1_i1.p1  ORF type:complete len:224 (-),score=33.87 TRINITY_DN50990_c0_g1_i1:78-749(-)
MVIPFADPSMPEGPVPEEVKLYHGKYWWAIVVLLAATSLAEIMGRDPFSGFFCAMLAVIAGQMAKDSCKNMSMYCLFFFGLITGMQAMFGLLTLILVLQHGRMTQTQEVHRAGDETTYTTKVNSHPMFDYSMGQAYNIKSVMLIVRPIIEILCCYMAYWSYSCFEASLFEDDEEATIYRGGGGFSGYGGAGPGRPRGGPPPRNGQGPGRDQVTAFQGRGQRLE